MNIVHILKKAPDESTKTIISIHAAEHQVTMVELYKGEIEYEKLVADVFASDKVFCW